MVSFLKERYSLPWLTGRKNRRSNRVSANVHYRDATDILVLFTMLGNARVTRMRSLQKLLEMDGKNVTFLYVLLDANDLPDAHMDDGMIRVRREDVSLYGKLANDKVKQLLENKFDFLIHGDMESNPYADYLLSKSKAKSKVGRHMEKREHLYDLMIEIGLEHKLGFLLEQIYKYTKVV